MYRLALAAAVLAGLAGAQATRAAEFGVVPDLTWGITPAEQERTAGVIADLGARWVRLNVQWKYWEYHGPSDSVQDSGSRRAADRSVDLARAAGARVVMMVYNAPDWAAVSKGGQGQVPRDPRDYARFMRTLASHYRGRVDAYEIWNEPDTSRFWRTGPDPAAYTELLRHAYAAVKEGDPAAQVVSGGLSWDFTKPGSFLERAYRAGAKGHFDVLGLHPYPHGDIDRWQGWYRAARRTMVANGDPKPIWFTEFGINTSSRSYDPSGGAWQAGVSEAAQAELLTAHLTRLEADPYVGVVCWYNLRNNYWSGDDPSSVEASFGLLRTDFSPKPAYFAAREYAAKPPPAAAETRPTVSLTTRSLRGRKLSVSAAVAGELPVQRVVFAVDGRTVATVTRAPYRVALKSRAAERVVTVTAYDTGGRKGSAEVTLTGASSALRR